MIITEIKTKKIDLSFKDFKASILRSKRGKGANTKNMNLLSTLVRKYNKDITVECERCQIIVSGDKFFKRIDVKDVGHKEYNRSISSNKVLDILESKWDDNITICGGTNG